MVESKKYNIHLVIFGNGTFVLHVFCCPLKDQDFSSSYDLAPSPPPLSFVSKLSRRHTGRLRMRDNLLTGKEGGGERAKSYDGEKAWYSVMQ
jgi:hypothetical protein